MFYGADTVCMLLQTKRVPFNFSFHFCVCVFRSLLVSDFSKEITGRVIYRVHVSAVEERKKTRNLISIGI